MQQTLFPAGLGCRAPDDHVTHEWLAVVENLSVVASVRLGTMFANASASTTARVLTECPIREHEKEC